jgi:hypothetical protein
LRFEIGELLNCLSRQRLFALLVLGERRIPRLVRLVGLGDRVQLILRSKPVEPPDFILRAILRTPDRLQREVRMRTPQLRRQHSGLRLDAVVLRFRTRLQRFASDQQDSWRRLRHRRNVHKQLDSGN